MINNPSKFTINRSKWSRGLGKSTELLSDDGKMDCLGFFLLASGLTTIDIKGCHEPIDIVKNVDWQTILINRSGNTFSQTQLCSNIIKINDEADLNDTDREKLLSLFFDSINIKLFFEN